MHEFFIKLAYWIPCVINIVFADIVYQTDVCGLYFEASKLKSLFLALHRIHPVSFLLETITRYVFRIKYSFVKKKTI